MNELRFRHGSKEGRDALRLAVLEVDREMKRQAEGEGGSP